MTTINKNGKPMYTELQRKSMLAALENMGDDISKIENDSQLNNEWQNWGMAYEEAGMDIEVEYKYWEKHFKDAGDSEAHSVDQTPDVNPSGESEINRRPIQGDVI